ncbi:serine hydrolase domain-containing protein [Flagellimonas flava]|uniref:serine hydrolase domain-containing protein n=1 Tax=Flagellimonas flava TaxID=570519 RepID=UPI003D6575C2
MKGKVPYTKNTLQNIASVSKTMIGLALLKTQEMGELNLDDPINDYLPFKVFNPYHPEATITIRHLATHTSSIQDGDLYGAKSYIMENANDATLAKSLPSSEEFNLPEDEIEMGVFLKNFLAEEGAWFDKANYLESRPSELYEYTNVGATLAAYIIERSTNQSYAQFTTQHILKPLGMSSSGWKTSNVDQSKRTHLFTIDRKRIPDYRLITYPDGGLITSIDDKAKYLSELIRGYHGKGELLSKESYEQFFSEFLSEENFEEEQDTDRPFDDEYNSGLFIGHTPIGYLGHMGGDPGVSTFMFFNPKTKIGKLLFVNTDLDATGAEQFYAIWDTLGEYELRLNSASTGTYDK